jgi:hypothetical protein
MSDIIKDVRSEGERADGSNRGEEYDQNSLHGYIEIS